MDLVIVVVVGVALMWFFAIRPQRRRASVHQRMQSTLAVGDEIVTAGGLYGTVTRVGEDDVTLELAPGVEVRLARRAVAAIVDDGNPLERERSREQIRG